MFVNSNEGQEIVQELSKKLVFQLAPEELEMFDELYEEYRANPQPPDDNIDDDDPLGFGVTEIMAAVTPAAGAAVSAVIAYLASEIVKSAKEESAVMIQKKIKAVFNQEQKEQQVELPALNQEMLEHIKKLTIKSARAQGLSAKTAKKMALTLVGLLALSG